MKKDCQLMTATSLSDYEKHPEGYFRRARESYNKSRESGEARVHRMIVEARCRAKKLGIPFSIEEVAWAPVCPILGLELTLEAGPRGGADTSPALDRIRNPLGYVDGNVHIISTRANLLKRDATLEELVALGEWAKNVLNTD